MVFYNPLNVEVTISNLTVVVKEAKHEDAETPVDFAEAEVVDEISLNAHETRTVRPALMSIINLFPDPVVLDSNSCQMLKTGMPRHLACNV